MKRRNFLNSIGTISGMMMIPPALASKQKPDSFSTPEFKEPLPGIWKFTVGTPDKITPQNTRNIPPDSKALQALPVVNKCTVEVKGKVSGRGVLISLSLMPEEQLYGLGLQLQSFQQRGLKKLYG